MLDLTLSSPEHRGIVDLTFLTSSDESSNEEAALRMLGRDTKKEKKAKAGFSEIIMEVGLPMPARSDDPRLSRPVVPPSADGPYSPEGTFELGMMEDEMTVPYVSGDDPSFSLLSASRE